MQKGKCSNLSQQEQKIIGDMQRWLYAAGAKYDDLEVVNFGAGYRGVISTKPIQKKERIVFIPHSELITLEMAKDSPICSQLVRSNVEFISPKHTYLAVFLLEELVKGQQSRWHLYLDILPKDHSSFPINYSNDELSELIGSPFLMQVHERVMDLKKDYDRVCLHSPTFRKYKFRDFCWARTMVGSRMFGLFIDGKKTDILAPFADMLNHKLPKQTTWNYIQEEKGFAIESLEDIAAGDEICDSYGRKCNTRYLLNYGFVMENNPENQLLLRMEIGGQFRAKKLEMMRKEDGLKILKISKNLNDSNFYESMGYLRFNSISDYNQLAVLEKISGIKITNLPYLPCKTPPLTVELEIKTWENLENLCKAQLNAYPTTLIEDQQLKKDPNLSYNMQNILILRMGDKQLLQFYIQICGEVIDVLKLGYLQAFVSISKKSQYPWCRYVLKILSIMPHEKRLQAPKINLSPSEEEEEHGSEQELSDE